MENYEKNTKQLLLREVSFGVYLFLLFGMETVLSRLGLPWPALRSEINESFMESFQAICWTVLVVLKFGLERFRRQDFQECRQRVRKGSMKDAAMVFGASIHGTSQERLEIVAYRPCIKPLSFRGSSPSMLTMSSSRGVRSIPMDVEP
jgi:hypothetical protein